MSDSFVFQSVGKIHFGVGKLSVLAKEAGAYGRKALLIADRHATQGNNRVEDIARYCRAAGADTHFFKTLPEGEPTLETVDRAREVRREANCDFLIGIGGGSVIDTAKAVAGLANEPAPIAEYFDGRAVTAKGAAWVAIPTTSGAGAEATKNAVLSDPSRNVKQSIRSDSFFANLVIVDPSLTVSCPPRVTADSGMDALAQAIESFTSLGANPVTDGLAFEAARLILRSLAIAYRDGGNIEARSDMALGSLLAGIALANARLGTIHGLAHPLGIRWKIPHGRICATLLAPIMRFNEGTVTEKYERLSTLAGGPIIEHVEQMCADLGIPGDLKEYKIAGDDVEWIIRESLPSGSLKMNPRPTTADDLKAILAPLI